MRALIFTSTLFLMVFHSVVAMAEVEEVQATIDKNPVMVDEAIRLTITANGSANRDAFDSSALLKDFVVGRTSVNSQTSIVNFDTKRTTTWVTTLFPRKEGSYTIPSFTIEGKQTQPITVKVIPVQQSDKVARDYFVTTDIDLQEAYLNQQLLYTVKLHLASNIERGSLQSPEMPNADIRQLGDDAQYTDIINGRRYQIIERKFAIVPQASGEFTIRGPIFTGEVAAPNTNQRFGFFNRTQQVNRVGPDITIQVNPIPKNIDYPWLPSEMVRLDEEWPQGETFTVGEPITRVVTLTAIGVVEEQLPDIPEFYPPNFKLYPDQSSTTTVEKDNALIAQRMSSLALIPTQAGNIVLPEVTIPWFNTVTEKTEYATLPARTVSVSPAAPSVAGQPSQSAPLPSSALDNPTTQAPEKPDSFDTDNKPASDISSTPSYLTWLFAVLWVLTAMGWAITYRKRRSLSTSSSASLVSTGKNSLSEADAFKQLKQTIRTKNSQDISASLQQWLKLLYPDAKGIISPSQFTETQGIQQPYNDLLSARFGKSSTQWDDKAFVQAIEDARKKVKESQRAGPHSLAPLYPSV